ncbi:MAG TPA: hypothetical protein VHO43_02155 [Ignavibacteriales bacterium]|nr:hypothetical protein [Ignavibacteriales bacterium]
MKFPVKLFLTAALAFVLSPTYAQTGQITAHFAESSFIKELYVISGETNSIPPSYFYSLEGYLYRIDLTLILDGKDFLWDKPIEAELILPDGTKRKETINKERLPLYPNEFYKFSFEISSPKKGWVNIALGAPSDVDETGVGFSGTSVCLR